MLRKVLVIVVAGVLVGLCANGCKKKPDEPGEPVDPNQQAVKIMQQERDKAAQEITKETMEQELAKLEKAVDQEIAEEP